jgi:hypothetical protein
MADRAQVLLWQHRAFNNLPRHVRAMDVAGIDTAGRLSSVGNVEEFCLLTEYASGEGYARDLERIRENGKATALDFARSDALCDYLVEIHRSPVNQPRRYARRIRELVGHGECIWGWSILTRTIPLSPE